MEKILIIRLSSIGDIILTTPLIRAVRQKYPQAQIDFLIKSQFKSLLTHNPHISRLITFDKVSNDIKSIKEVIKNNKYDWIIDIHRNFRSYYLTSGVGAKLVTRHKKYIIKRQLLVWLGINVFSEKKPVLERYFEAVRGLGVKYDEQGTEVFYSENHMALVNDLMVKEGCDENGRIIVICPGASFANKRWLPERLAVVGDELAYKENAQIVLLGGPEDKELCDTVRAKMRINAFNFAGKLSLLGSTAMLSKAIMAISNDTGLMHLAQSQNVPVVAIFGPTTEELGYFPIPNRSVVVQANVGCRPCTHNGLDKCPKGHFKCMDDISTDTVVEVSHELLTKE